MELSLGLPESPQTQFHKPLLSYVGGNLSAKCACRRPTGALHRDSTATPPGLHVAHLVGSPEFQCPLPSLAP